VLSEAEQFHLDQVIYPRALAAAKEPDTRRNRDIAASDYWHFLQLGGGGDAEAVAALTRGLRPCGQ
jgi:hypothetical protein